MTGLTVQDRLTHLNYYETTLRTQRYGQEKHLLRHGSRVDSQNDEDGIIQEIFHRIGSSDKRFIKFGVQDGRKCNSLLLLCSGWSGMWLETNGSFIDNINDSFAPFIRNGRLVCQQQKVNIENINDLLGAMTGYVDLLSIDIDFNDYWVWQALDVIWPRLVVIEYNASLKPPWSLAVPYDPDGVWDGSNLFGASLAAFEKLGVEKKYSLVGCCFLGVNAFFVRNDLKSDYFCAPYTAQNHYEPPRYFMHYPVGHQPGIGRYVTV